MAFDPNELLFLGGYLALPLIFVGLLLGVLGLKDYLFIGKEKEIPVSKVGSAAVGLVKLAGKASAFPPLLSPVTNSPCAFWRVTAHIADGGIASDTSIPGYNQIYKDQSSEPFYLEDETGRIRIEPGNAGFDLQTGVKSTAGLAEILGENTYDEQPGGIRARKFYASLPDEKKKLFQNYLKKTWIQIDEHYLGIDRPLFVLGYAVPADEEPGDGQSLLKVTGGSGDRTLYFSDMAECDVSGCHSSLLYPKMFGGFAMAVSGLFFFTANLDLFFTNPALIVIELSPFCAVALLVLALRRWPN